MEAEVCPGSFWTNRPRIARSTPKVLSFRRDQPPTRSGRRDRFLGLASSVQVETFSSAPKMLRLENVSTNGRLFYTQIMFLTIFHACIEYLMAEVYREAHCSLFDLAAGPPCTVDLPSLVPSRPPKVMRFPTD